MDYQVTLTPQAMEQLRQTALYIAHTLQESETAKRWANEEARIVYVTAVIYGRRDQLAALADITQD